MSLLWTRYNEDRMPTDLKQALRVWQTRFRKLAQDRNLNPDAIWKVVRQTNAWINAIELKFDPPITLEMTRPCPKCEHQHVYNEHNERVSAVIITWQKSFDKSLAQCRACGQTWLGESELRQLRYDVDQKDTLWGIG
jgi:transcription elongation factor Elf1